MVEHDLAGKRERRRGELDFEPETLAACQKSVQ
jgi:hypothetical protein